MSRSTSWNPESYARNARFVSDLGEPLLRLLDPKPGELILDLGCGDGALTEKITACGACVIAMDASRPQVEATRKRGLTAIVMNGHQLGLKQCFDAVFTNAALHWMKRPERVVASVWNCLKPGGRFVGEFGGQGNVEKIRAALYAGLRKRGIDPWTVDPWYFPSPEKYSRLLTQAGFSLRSIEMIPRPTRLPGNILGWLEVFAQSFTRSVAESDRERFLNDVRAKLEPILRDSDGTWIADYVRLRFKAERQGGAGLKPAPTPHTRN